MPDSAVYHVQVADGPLAATVTVPGSKSIANRALVCATLAEGLSVLHNVPGGDDTAAMLDCTAMLGAGVGVDPHDETRVRVHGTAGVLHRGPFVLSTRLAGTTSRFVTALCALGTGTYVVDGDMPLRGRPMAPLHDALVALGAGVQAGETWGHLPVSVTGIADRDGGGSRSTVRIRGDVSSQYITALMLIAPYLPGGLRIELTTELVSRPYLAITAAVMAAFGAHGVVVGDDHVEVEPGRYEAREYVIEPDASTASYPLAAAAICGGSVRVADLGAGALQGDARFADVLAEMGCTVRRDATGVTVERTGLLHGLSIDMADLSDLVPTLAVVAPFADSPTEITGVGFIRAKESDRLGDLAAELAHCGVTATVLDDGIRIEPGFGAGAGVETHHDHRLAMAFGVLGLRLGGMRVHDPEVVTKSWPEFWAELEALRATAEEPR
ncbi:MAG: aroA [Ilumatobacteraceae bacterium]|nr:aroA [Ilumatobacteraceae bacterium]